jgi:hypothetical protein
MATPKQLLRFFALELKDMLVRRQEPPQAFIEAFQREHETDLDAFFEGFLSHLPRGTMTFRRYKVACALTVAPQCVEWTLDGTIEKARWVKAAVRLMRRLEAALVLNLGPLVRGRFVRRFDKRSMRALDLKDLLDAQSRCETPVCLR